MSERLGLRPSLAQGLLALARLHAGRGDWAAAGAEAGRARALAEDVGRRLVTRDAGRLAER
ncbi:hypothetical protein [Geodermatophilus sp. CPCC 206100]|uniref:hypothetical protein n=1 Tax=Geodermatophilus sp. CPCC 206100 TaxID=3020054 RepID=UPI003B00A16F